MAWFSDISLHRARKRHCCDWCSGAIPPDEVYAKYVSTFDGFQVTKMHTECLAASKRDDAEEWHTCNPRGLTDAEKEYTFQTCEQCNRWEYAAHIVDGLCRECRRGENHDI